MLLRPEGSSSVVTVEKDTEVLVTVENDDGGEPNTLLLSFEDGDSDDPRVRQYFSPPYVGWVLTSLHQNWSRWYRWYLSLFNCFLVFAT